MKFVVASIMALIGSGWLSAPAGAQSGAAPAGTWTQSSSGKELVLAPKFKLQPNVGVGYGTNLGGSVGYGSMTRTTIVTEPTIMNVTRSMTLIIAADGQFKWTIVKRHADGDNCTRTTTQVKQGSVSAGGGKMVFAIRGGSERWQSSCGKQGSGAIAPSREEYSMSAQGRLMHLASGPVRWAFSRN